MVQLETAARLRQHWKEKGSPPAITRYWTRNKPLVLTLATTFVWSAVRASHAPNTERGYSGLAANRTRPRTRRVRSPIPESKEDHPFR